jgi:predicted nucleic acid-binding protein
LILVDTSIWIEHFRDPLPEIETLMAGVLIAQHPFVTGELALGDLKDRTVILDFLSQDLPAARIATDAEFLEFVATAGLVATGIGFVDAHLLAACRLDPGTLLWSRDKRLAWWAQNAGLAWSPG